MAFTIKNFGKVGNQSRRGASPQLCIYRTSDAIATVLGNNYFRTVAGQLEVGDRIILQIVQDLDVVPVTVTSEHDLRITVNTPESIVAIDTSADGG